MGSATATRGEQIASATLGVYAYLCLVIVDLATTTILLRQFPDQAREANQFLAAQMEAGGFGALWVWKLAGAALVVLLYGAVRAFSHSARMRRLVDAGLVASCAVQGAVVLVNIAGFRALAG